MASMLRVSAILMMAGLTCSSFGQSPNVAANELVRSVLNNEIKAEIADHSHWMFRLDTKRPNSPETVDEVVETRDGPLKYPILIDGRKLTDAQQQQANNEIQHAIHDPTSMRKADRAQADDDEHSHQMLKIFPSAFRFQYGERKGDLVQLNFTPNPNFRPPNREATVFHAMEGSIWLDTKQKRLAEINGHLMHEVKFGWGMLGYLDQGGHFHVQQAEVAPGYWELTLLDVQMNGKALFFKTIAVRQKYARSDFRQVPPNLEVAKAAQMLRSQAAAQVASLR
jgi:hypothetical protein